MGIELLGCRPHWTGPLCEIGISWRSVYQMTTSREQARDECNCARATERRMESCEWLGDVTSKSIDRFAVETVRKRIQNLLALNVPRRQAIRHGKNRKGLWHRAMTIASGVGMTNAWLAKQRVLRHKSFWPSLVIFVEPPGAAPHAVLGWSETTTLTRLIPVVLRSLSVSAGVLSALAGSNKSRMHLPSALR